MILFFLGQKEYTYDALMEIDGFHVWLIQLDGVTLRRSEKILERHERKGVSWLYPAMSPSLPAAKCAASLSCPAPELGGLPAFSTCPPLHTFFHSTAALHRQLHSPWPVALRMHGQHRTIRSL